MKILDDLLARLRGEAATETPAPMPALEASPEPEEPDEEVTLLSLPEPEAALALVSPATPQVVKAEVLLEAWDRNALAAEQRYGGRTLAVVGEVVSVQRDHKGRPFVGLAPGLFWGDVRVRIRPEQEAWATRLVPGEEVCLIATVERYDINRIWLDATADAAGEVLERESA